MKELLELKGLPKGYISASQLSMLLRCPKQYEFRYVKEIKIPPPFVLALGTSSHITIQRSLYDDYIRKKPKEFFIETYKQIEKEEELDYQSKTKSEIKQEINISGETTKLYIEYNDEYYKILNTEDKIVEKETTVDIEGFKLVMYYDIELKDKIIDWKLVKRKPNITGFQLQVYRYFSNKDLQVHYLLKQKIPSAYIEYVELNNKDIIMEEIKKLITFIKTGIFFRNPGFDGINCRGCGYFNLCKPNI